MRTFDFCVADAGKQIHPVTADSIYYVAANRHYRVSHLPVPGSLVLVATLDGQGTLQLKNHRLIVNGGDILLFDASSSIFSYYCSDDTWKFWWFEFRCLTADFLDIPPETPLRIPLDSIQLYLCDEALNQLKLKDSKTASALLASLLCLLQKKRCEVPDQQKGVELFRQADRYIRQNLHSVTVASAARYLQVSERTLLNVFRSLLGIRTTEYIHNLKTDTARHLLLTSENSVKQIAELLGYSDPFSFSKSFRSRFQLSPSQYKAVYRENGGEIPKT